MTRHKWLMNQRVTSAISSSFDILEIWSYTITVIARVHAVKNAIFRGFIPHSSFEQTRPVDSEYVSGSILFCHFEW